MHGRKAGYLRNLGLVTALVFPLACGGSETANRDGGIGDGGPEGGSTGGGTNEMGPGGANAATGGVGGGTTGAGGNGSGGAPASDCELALYILFDQSGSMSLQVGNVTRMDAVRDGFHDFLQSSDAARLNLGIGYFGADSIGSASCNADDYGPAVPIGADNVSVIAASLDSVNPRGETPTGPALVGACRYAKSWQAQHPDRDVRVLLLTDGLPGTTLSRERDPPCDPTLSEAVAAAAACATEEPRVPVHVITVGPLLENMSQVAAAGGTDLTSIVSDDVQNEISAALRALSAGAPLCNR